MPWGVAAAAVATAGTVYAANTSANAQQSAANTQANAALQQQGNLLAAGQQASQQFTPYSNYGTTALGSLAANNAYFNQQFSNQDLNTNLAPNYDFMLKQGLTGAAQQANATGGLVGGNAQQALQTFGQNYAGNAYQNAFNNFQVQRGNISALDLANANLGLSGATGSANAQLGTATNVANLGIGSANAQAASQIAQGNIYGNAANTIGGIGYSTLQSMMPSQYGSVNSGGNLGSLNYQEPTIGGAPTGGYSNMGGSGYGIGGYSPQVQG